MLKFITFTAYGSSNVTHAHKGWTSLIRWKGYSIFFQNWVHWFCPQVQRGPTLALMPLTWPPSFPLASSVLNVEICISTTGETSGRLLLFPGKMKVTWRGTDSCGKTGRDTSEFPCHSIPWINPEQGVLESGAPFLSTPGHFCSVVHLVHPHRK